MEFRVLQYFLAVAREESVSGAAAFLHLSQPTLSRQLKDLEDELGKRLFIRGSRKITLTEEGMLLRKRAEEIVQLMRKAEDEIALSDETVAGNIYIGSGETDAVRFLVEAQSALQQEYPQICFHIQSGDKITILEWLDRGLVDVGLVFGHVDTAKYDALEVPFKDTYGGFDAPRLPAFGKNIYRTRGPMGQTPHPIPPGIQRKPFAGLAEKRERAAQYRRHL